MTTWLPLLVLAACTGDTDDTGPSVDLTCTERATPDSDMAALVAGNSTFAWDLYEALAPSDGNLFFSPFSLSAALGMTYGGARGETATEMADVLAIGLEDPAFHAAFGALIADLQTEPDCVVDVAIANRLFGQVDYPWEADFLTLAETDWQAPLQEVDFQTDPDGARDTINAWVADQTRDRIDELIPTGIITALTRMVLTNAIAFQASWRDPFDPADTYSGDFHAPDGDVTADLMLMEAATLRIGEVDGFQVLELPYAGETTSMVVLLPWERDGLEALTDLSLDADTVATLVAATSEVEEVRLVLPKFSLRQNVLMNDVLEGMGMVQAFDPDLADLTGLANAPDGNLYIQAVLHEAFIAVDEAGTEAAAATAVVVGVESAPPSFIADHPFVFFIRDTVTDAVLFLGRVEDPTLE